MSATRNISPQQFAVLVVSAYLGLGIFQFPHDLVTGAGPDAPYALGLEFAAALAGFWLWTRAGRLMPSETVVGAAWVILPAWLYYPWLLVTVAVRLGLAVFVQANLGLVMHTVFLDSTPYAFIVLSGIACATYLAWYDTVPLARAIESIFLPTAALSVAIGLLLVPRLHRLYGVLPALHFFLLPTVRAAYDGFYAVFGFEVAMTLYPYVRVTQHRPAQRLAYLAMIASFLFLSLGYLLVMGAAGPGLVTRLQWPGVAAMSIISVTGFLVNKLGLLVVVLWATFVLAALSIRLCCLAHDLMPPFRRTSLAAYRWFLATGAGAVFVGCLFVPNPVGLAVGLHNWLLPMATAYVFGSPLLILAAARRFGQPRAATSDHRPQPIG